MNGIFSTYQSRHQERLALYMHNKLATRIMRHAVRKVFNREDPSGKWKRYLTALACGMCVHRILTGRLR